MGFLLYGIGRRRLECLTLRVKDVDLERGEIRLRRGKGGVDRVTVLPQGARPRLEEHLARVRAQHTEAAAGRRCPARWTGSSRRLEANGLALVDRLQLKLGR